MLGHPPDPGREWGAVATIEAFTADQLFLGQPDAFFDFIMALAKAADAAHREL